MLKKAFIALVLLAAGFSQARAQTSVTIYGDNDYAPYSFQDAAGDAQGVYVEALRRAFAKLDGYDVTIALVPWKEALAHLEIGTGFAAFPPYYRPKARPYIQPYSEPILTESVQIVCRAEVLETARETFPHSYHGLRFANNAGFQTPGEAFFAAVDAGEIALDESGGTAENLQKLIDNRADCYVNDRLAILDTLKSMGHTASDAGLAWGGVVSEDDGYVGYARDADAFPFKADFVEKLDAIIVDMKASGEIDAIFNALQ